jgi:hypothetical protein
LETDGGRQRASEEEKKGKKSIYNGKNAAQTVR